MPLEEDLKNPSSPVMPWYWISQSDIDSRLIEKDKNGDVKWQWGHKWLMGICDITNATNERTIINTLIPNNVGSGDTINLCYLCVDVVDTVVFLGMSSSLVFDYVARQKLGGSHASISYVKQFPVLTPKQINEKWQTEIITRVAELCYFNHDLDGWAEELAEELSDEQKSLFPNIVNQTLYVYDPEPRAVLQTELDAIFAKLYGLNTENLKYIFDPEDVCRVGCINETFRVLKDSEIREFGEYRIKWLVMEAWGKHTQIIEI
ncbi:MAG: hypothetical protein K6G31_05875 [Paludibacteraceae bacterium]|nr:hypothetical protein [Paludibacteraceae bacterium]